MEPVNIAAIESYGIEPLAFIHKGERYTLPHPARMTVEDIMSALSAETLREVPLDMPVWKSLALFNRWVAHHDLPDFQGAQRLLFVVERYRSDLEYDLQVHIQVDIDELFRSRRWRRLLNFIDRLPRESWYTEAVSNDREHAEMLARAMAERGESKEAYHPPLRTWSQEASLLADLLGAVRNLTHATISVGGGKPGQPEPVPRPTSELEKAQKIAIQNRKKIRHEALVAKLLPHKAKRGG